MHEADAAIWRNIGHAVARRRSELDLNSQSQLAERAGVHLNTVSRLESGSPAQRIRSSWAAIEDALEWPRGTIAAMAGIRPNTAVPLTADAVTRAVLDSIHEVEPTDWTIPQANQIAAKTVARLERDGLLPSSQSSSGS